MKMNKKEQRELLHRMKKMYLDLIVELFAEEDPKIRASLETSANRALNLWLMGTYDINNDKV